MNSSVNNYDARYPWSVERRLKEVETQVHALNRAPEYAAPNWVAQGMAWLIGGNSFAGDYSSYVIGTLTQDDFKLYRNGKEFLGLYDSEADFGVPVYTSNYGSPYDYYEALMAFEYAPSGAVNTTAIRGYGSTRQPGAGTIGQLEGVEGVGIVGSGNAHDVTRLMGLRGRVQIEGGTSGVVTSGIGVLGEAFPNPGGGGVATLEKAYSVFGEIQTLGTSENWSGYFQGDTFIGGRLVGTNSSINLPIAIGAVPTAGMYAPVIVDYACTVLGVRIRFYDVAGAPVSDTATININRVDWATDTPTNLNPSPFGPSGVVKSVDTTLTSWSKDLAAHDSLQAELVVAPATAVSMAVSLDVVRA